MKKLKHNSGLFGPSLRIMDVTGIGLRRKNIGYKVFVSMTVSVTVYVFTALYELWLLRDKLEEALHNASITIVGVMVSLKCASLIYRQERWRQLISGLSRLELNILCENDVTSKAIIGDYIKYLRILGCVYAVLVFGTNATFISPPLLKFASTEYRIRLRNGTATYQNIFSSWYPFDKTKPPGYWVTVVVEIFVNLYGGLIITVFDVNVVAVMVFMKGHIQILREKCQIIFGNSDGIITEREAEARIKECSRYHTSLLKYSKMLDELLSPIMFFYVIGCSLCICGTVVQFTKDTNSRSSLIQPVEYTLALLGELILFCWHAQQVFDESDVVHKGVYESAWWLMGAKGRKLALMLMGQVQTHFVYNIGPTSRLTVVTILNIIRATYSYYTFLNKSKSNI